jgi:hypothetical protein
MVTIEWQVTISPRAKSGPATTLKKAGVEDTCPVITLRSTKNVAVSL